MQFHHAIAQLSNGRAAKTPSMNGYVKREDYENNPENAALFTLDAEDVFDIVFVENPMRPEPPKEHRFLARSIRDQNGFRRLVFDDTKKETMLVDAGFLNQLFSDAWEVCDVALLEEALKNRNTGRW